MAVQSDLTKQQGALTGAFDSSGGGFDAGGFDQWLKKQAESMGKVQGATDLPTGVSSQLGSGTGQALKQDFETQKSVLGAQAERDKQAFLLQGQGFSNMMQQTGEAKKTASTRNKAVDDKMAQAEATAQQYVADARTRAAEMTSKIDALHQTTLNDMDAGKAHDMQVNVQGYLAQNKQALKQIEMQYGKDSAEYAQTQQAYKTGLGSVMSGVQATYAKLRTEANMAYETTASEVQKAGGQFIGYNEQNHTQMLQANTALVASEAARRSEFDLAVSQLEGTAYENMANWLAATPVRSVGLTSIISYLAAKETAAQQMQMLEKSMAQQTQTGGGGGGYTSSRIITGFNKPFNPSGVLPQGSITSA